MAYLFWAFAAVWVGIVLYLYGLIRRSQALEREVEALRERGATQAGGTAPHPGGTAGGRP